VSIDLAYVPCQCAKCRQRPVHGVCRCVICGGRTPEQIRARQRETALLRCEVLLNKEDGPDGITDEEAEELERLLYRLA
jgi:hypothetical protein